MGSVMGGLVLVLLVLGCSDGLSVVYNTRLSLCRAVELEREGAVSSKYYALATVRVRQANYGYDF